MTLPDNEDERFQKPWKVEPQVDRDLSDRLRYLEGELAASRSDVAPLEAKIIATEAERDQLREEVGRLRDLAQYALHAVRASLSYKQERNAARAECALLRAVDPGRTPMSSFGYELEREVAEHLAEEPP